MCLKSCPFCPAHYSSTGDDCIADCSVLWRYLSYLFKWTGLCTRSILSTRAWIYAWPSSPFYRARQISLAWLLVWASSSIWAGLQIGVLHCSLQHRRTFNDSAKSAPLHVLESGLLCCGIETCLLPLSFVALGQGRPTLSPMLTF